MPKKPLASKRLPIIRGVASVQVQVIATTVATSEVASKHFGPHDLRAATDKFEQTLELKRTKSTPESTTNAYEGCVLDSINNMK
ncbi:hypothetical protein GUJ93_ZPchr0008g12709 [Zizania palustris]|uniref:Uncharacterized protein n=1 Tax=Zizania palustris TaxID=103762 RepID=A0A8J5R6Q3_ZIZPA|nr:hypothetical protein GUJ93_ZPchr0008g12709 [Zizania palustris]